jgi:hypothetical protein
MKRYRWFVERWRTIVDWFVPPDRARFAGNAWELA